MSVTPTEKPTACTAIDIAVLASYHTGMDWYVAYDQYLHQDSPRERADYPRERADYRLTGSKAGGYGFDTAGIYTPHCDVLDKAERDRRQVRYETKAEAAAAAKEYILRFDLPGKAAEILKTLQQDMDNPCAPDDLYE